MKKPRFLWRGSFVWRLSLVVPALLFGKVVVLSVVAFAQPRDDPPHDRNDEYHDHASFEFRVHATSPQEEHWDSKTL